MKLKSTTITPTLTAVIVLLVSPIMLPRALAAIEPSGSAQNVVAQIIEKAKTLDNLTLKKDATKDIESRVDFAELTNQALGRRHRDISASDRKQIQELLKTIITKTVYPEASKFFSDVSIEYTNHEQSGALAHITSVLTKSTKRSTVEYWLSNTSGEYRVVDLAIEGERWVENVRDQFDDIIRTNGVKGLIAKMKKRAAELR